MRSWLTYIAAFIAALFGAYATLRLGAYAMFSDAMNLGFIISAIFPPLAGLAFFSLVYGVINGRALKGKFWAAGLGLVAVSYAIGWLLLTSGLASVGTIAGIMVVFLFVTGRAALAWSGDA